MILKFKKYKCYICNSGKGQNLSYGYLTFKKFFFLKRCYKCNTFYSNLIPANKFTMNKIYDFGGVDKLDESKNNFLSTLLHNLRFFQLRKISTIIDNYKFKQRSTILDYGTGDGYLANYFFLKKNQVYASDFSNKRIKSLKNKIIYFSNKNIFLQTKKFDFIIMRHVLEHIPYPKSVIKKLKKLLKPNGLIIIEVPNHSEKKNLFLKLFKSNYSQLCLPHHVNHFNQNSLKKVFNFNKIDTLEFVNSSVPILGNSIFNFLGFRNNRFDLFNLLLFPIQILLEKISSTSTAILLIYKKNY